MRSIPTMASVCSSRVTWSPTRVDVLEELDVTHGNLGFTGSAAGWYDVLYNQKNNDNSQSNLPRHLRPVESGFDTGRP